MALKDKITALANSIRTKSGRTGKLGWDEMKEAVDSIAVGSGGDGLDTSSTNPATAEDIANGKEAFVNGNKVVGNVTTYESGLMPVLDAKKVSSYHNNTKGYMVSELKVDMNKNILFRNGSTLCASIACTEFGDAVASDVASGKTFTSKDGVMQTGTHVCSGGGLSLPSGITAMTTGEFTPDADITEQYTITHNLNTTPSVFVLEPCGSFKLADNKGYILQCVINTKKHTASSVVNGMSVVTVVDANSGNAITTSFNNPACTSTTITLPTYTARKLKAGTTYKWVAIAMEGIN